MDPITIGLALVALFVVTRKPAPAAAPANYRAPTGTTGSYPLAPTMTFPPLSQLPAPPGPEEVSQAMFSGSSTVAAGARNALATTLDNITATARQRATGIAGGLDPAYVDAGSALAARDFMSRGLQGAVSSTLTGQALQRAAAATGAQALAAGATVAQTTATVVGNAVADATNAAHEADAATAAFIDRNTPRF